MAKSGRNDPITPTQNPGPAHGHSRPEEARKRLGGSVFKRRKGVNFRAALTRSTASGQDETMRNVRGGASTG
jgi:hypothetical protein